MQESVLQKSRLLSMQKIADNSAYRVVKFSHLRFISKGSFAKRFRYKYISGKRSVPKPQGTQDCVLNTHTYTPRTKDMRKLFSPSLWPPQRFTSNS